YCFEELFSYYALLKKHLLSNNAKAWLLIIDPSMGKNNYKIAHINKNSKMQNNTTTILYKKKTDNNKFKDSSPATNGCIKNMLNFNIYLYHIQLLVIESLLSSKRATACLTLISHESIITLLKSNLSKAISHFNKVSRGIRWVGVDSISRSFFILLNFSTSIIINYYDKYVLKLIIVVNIRVMYLIIILPSFPICAIIFRKGSIWKNINRTIVAKKLITPYRPWWSSWISANDWLIRNHHHIFWANIHLHLMAYYPEQPRAYPVLAYFVRAYPEQASPVQAFEQAYSALVDHP
ncbi:hypothetical protein AGLY_009555, partial [Aphis glycines]